MNGKLLTYFEKAAISNKISHAFWCVTLLLTKLN